VKKKRKVFGFLLLLAFLIGIAGVIFLMSVVNSVSKVAGGAGQELALTDNLRYSLRLNKNLDGLTKATYFADLNEKKFTIEQTNRAFDVCQNLETESFVSSASTFCDFLIYKGFDRSLSPGTYTINNGLNLMEIASFIADGSNRDIQFTIFEGWRLEEIAEMLDQYSFQFSGQQFLAFALLPSEQIQTVLSLPEGRSLEGFISPGLYSLKPTTTLEEFVTESVSRFVNTLAELKSGQNTQPISLTDYQVLTLASIIQRETLAEEEMPLIASVLYNRLAIGMKLETDPTVQYGIGYVPGQETWWKTALTFDDLSTISEYNTYQVYGLPPGPICSPGKEAIQAAFAPAETGYFFFRAKCDGSLTHNFATTYEEHLANGCE